MISWLLAEQKRKDLKFNDAMIYSIGIYVAAVATLWDSIILTKPKASH